MSSENSDTSGWSNFARPGEERMRVSRRRNSRTYGRQPLNRPHRRPHIVFVRPDTSSSSSSSSNRMSARERRVIMAARPATPPQRPATPPSPIRTPSPFIPYRYRDPVPEENNNEGGNDDWRDTLIEQLYEQRRQLQLRLDEAMIQNARLADRVSVLENENMIFRDLHQQSLARDAQQHLTIRALQQQLAAERNGAPRIILSDPDILEEVAIDSPISPISPISSGPDSPVVAPEGPDASPIPGPSGLQVSPPRGKKRRSSSDDDNGTPEKRARPASPYSRPSLSPIPGPSNAVTPPPGSPISPWRDDPYFKPRIPPPGPGRCMRLSPQISPASSVSRLSSSSSLPPSPSSNGEEGPVDLPSPRRSPASPPPWRNGLHRYDLRTNFKRPNYNVDALFEEMDFDWDD